MQTRVFKMAQLIGTAASCARGTFAVAERAKISVDRILYLDFPVTNTNDVEQALVSSMTVTFLSTFSVRTNTLYNVSRDLYVLVRIAKLMIDCSAYKYIFVLYQGGFA